MLGSRTQQRENAQSDERLVVSNAVKIKDTSNGKNRRGSRGYEVRSCQALQASL